MTASHCHSWWKWWSNTLWLILAKVMTALILFMSVLVGIELTQMVTLKAWLRSFSSFLSRNQYWNLQRFWHVQLWGPRADQPPPLPYKAAGLAMIQALICMIIYLYLLPRVPLSKFSSPEYQKWGLVDRLGFMYISGFTARWKYYFIWSISQVAMIISGLGFSGWCTTASSSEPTPDWTRAKNVDIVKVELAKSGVELPMYWNISVSTWLRHCILLLCFVSLCCQIFFVILLIPSFWWEVVWNHNTTQQVFLILHCRTYEWLLFEWLAERLLCLCYGFWSSFLITNTDVYERLVPKGSKAGFAQLLSTQVTSAVWHVCSLSHELWIMNPFHLPSSTVH